MLHLMINITYISIQLTVSKKKDVPMRKVHHSDQTAENTRWYRDRIHCYRGWSDILKTGILACIGAVISFGVSKGLHKIWPGAHPDHPEGRE